MQGKHSETGTAPGRSRRRSAAIKVRGRASGTRHGAPGLRPQYHANYYGAYVLDPDGNNIEAVCHDAP